MADNVKPGQEIGEGWSILSGVTSEKKPKIFGAIAVYAPVTFEIAMAEDSEYFLDKKVNFNDR